VNKDEYIKRQWRRADRDRGGHRITAVITAIHSARRTSATTSVHASPANWLKSSRWRNKV